MARPRPALPPCSVERWNLSKSLSRSRGATPGPLSSTAIITRLPRCPTLTRTMPPEPACRHALSIRTPARRSIHSGGALIQAGRWLPVTTWMSKSCVAASARNRSAQAAAMVARSSGSSTGSGGVESNRASQSRSSTIRRSLPPSPSMRESTARYSAGSRGALSATLVSALITLSGVRSSCEASAVNSSCRLRDCSTGSSARMPIVSAPPNMASSRIGATSVSPSRSSAVRWSLLARPWPAMNLVPRTSAATNRNGPCASRIVTARPAASRKLAGSAGPTGPGSVSGPAAVWRHR